MNNNSLTKKMLLFLLVMAVVAGVGWYGRKVYKQVAERRAVAHAAQYLGKKDFPNAALCLQRALQVNPLSAPAGQLMGDLFDAAGFPAALSWRIHTAQLETNNVSYRFAWAQTALKLHDPASAAVALSNLDDKTRSSVDFLKLKGALDWECNNRDGAEQSYVEALRLEPTNQTLILNLATVRLTSTNKTVADTARAALERIPTNSVLRTTALRHLAKDAAAQKNWTGALRYSKAVLDDPGSMFDDKIDHLQLLREAKSPGDGPWLAGLQTEAKTVPAQAYALGRWMAAVTGPTNALVWLQSLPVTTQTNNPVPLVLADCQVAMKDWKGLLELVVKQNWSEVNSYRLALESLARRSLGQDLAAQTAWRQALAECSHRLDRLSHLSQITGLWGWKLEKTEVLKTIITEFPREKWAADQLIAELYAAGNTVGLGEALTRICEADPSDFRMKNCLANVFLLRKTELEKAHRLAREAYHSSTNNPFFISTYAYSLLLQNKPAEALKVVDSLQPEYLEIPSVSAYYGIIQAQSGHKDAAKAPLERAEIAALLPEEKAMVRLAKARP